MIIPMLCVTIFVILVVWFLLPRVARLMIHTPTAISIFVRSEERFSRNAETDLVCRLLLEKKNVEVDATQVAVAVGPDHLVYAFADVEHRDVEGAAAQVVDRDA